MNKTKYRALDYSADGKTCRVLSDDDTKLVAVVHGEGELKFKRAALIADALNAAEQED